MQPDIPEARLLLGDRAAISSEAGPACVRYALGVGEALTQGESRSAQRSQAGTELLSDTCLLYLCISHSNYLSPSVGHTQLPGTPICPVQAEVSSFHSSDHRHP